MSNQQEHIYTSSIYKICAVRNGQCREDDHSLLLEEERSFLGPPRIRDICRPLLNAWLNNILVWNSDTNGNQAKKATGINSSNPIIIS